MNRVVSKQDPLHHYLWGTSCDSWELLAETNISIKQERIPGGASEQIHFHEKSSQFFFILSGVATVEIEGKTFELKALEGIAIHALQKHRILNKENVDLEFILCSQPAVGSDRINV